MWIDGRGERCRTPSLSGLGRGHYRAALLLKHRPDVGVQELAQLTGLSKQGASRVLADLEKAGFVEKAPAKGDGRRKPAQLTAEGRAFEARVSERLRNHLARAYRSGGLDAVAGGRGSISGWRWAGSRAAVSVVGRGRTSEARHLLVVSTTTIASAACSRSTCSRLAPCDPARPTRPAPGACCWRWTST